MNPDEIQQDIEDRGFLNVRDYGVETTREEILPFFVNSTLLQKANNRCIEVEYLRAKLLKRGYSEAHISAALQKLTAAADAHGVMDLSGLYQVNLRTYQLIQAKV